MEIINSKLKQIFSEEWSEILDIYKIFVQSIGCTDIADNLLFSLVEIGVRFGERLSKLTVPGFIEIGCGLAIPSLTLSKLGQVNGTAIDIDNKSLIYAEDIRKMVKCDLKFQCADVFEKKPVLQKGEILVAEKPASYKNNILEIEYKIRNYCTIEGFNLALIPSYMGTDTIDSYSDRCAMYEKKFKQTGFEVENQQILEMLPFRWLIAVR
ncbi:hypothetical protein J7K93_05360 [bacterium]|nr:hypothetical protein [bacterium]